MHEAWTGAGAWTGDSLIGSIYGGSVGVGGGIGAGACGGANIWIWAIGGVGGGVFLNNGLLVFGLVDIVT